MWVALLRARLFFSFFSALEMLQSIITEVQLQMVRAEKGAQGKRMGLRGRRGILLRGRFKTSVKPVVLLRASVWLFFLSETLTEIDCNAHL